MHRARLLYQDEPTVLDLEMPVYAVDSTLIDLSLALCPWAVNARGDLTHFRPSRIDPPRL